MAGLVIDASVAVKWFLDEDRSAAALELRETDLELFAPSSVLIEVFHALWVAARARRFAVDQLRNVAPLIGKPFARLIPIAEVLERAAGLTHNFGHPIYDCVYLAAGAQESAEVITADQRMYQIGRQARIPVRLL